MLASVDMDSEKKGVKQMIRVVAENTVKKDKVEEFIKLAEKLEEMTNQKDEGCIHYALYQDLNDPQKLTFLEEWDSMKALNQHMAAGHFKEIVPQMEALTEGKSVNLYKKAGLK